MSTIDRPKLAPLVAGERMTRPEFHERYQAMPPGIRAELIAGVVLMPSPSGLSHANEHAAWMGWLYVYRSRTPGVEAFDNVSVDLNEGTEVQPDACLRIANHKGKRPRSNANMSASPEFVVEVSISSKAIDLGPKLAEYERAGTLEYVVHAVDIDEIFWHVRHDGRFVRIAPDIDGSYRSAAFPGLWLDPVALLADDAAGLLDVLGRGTASPDHAAFIAQLAVARNR